MLILNPSRVTFAGTSWDGVTAIAIDHAAAPGDFGVILDWGDAGAYPVFADVAERKVSIKLEQPLERTTLAAPRPGDQGELSMYASEGGSEAGRVRIAVPLCVVLRVTHELAGGKAPRRVIEFAALSENGVADPVQIAPAEAQS